MPLSHVSSPVIHLSTVVFPAPDFPTIEITSPSFALKLTPLSTDFPPNDLYKPSAFKKHFTPTPHKLLSFLLFQEFL